MPNYTSYGNSYNSIYGAPGTQKWINKYGAQEGYPNGQDSDASSASNYDPFSANGGMPTVGSSAAGSPYANTSLFNSSGTPTSNATDSSGGGDSSALGALNIVGAGIGAYEFFNAQKHLKQLNATPYPTYSVSPELSGAYSRAQGMSNQGYTAGEKAGYQNNINQQGATAYQRAIGSGGGNLSNVISAGINSSQVGAENQFSINDAELRRKNMAYADSLAKDIQSQKNLASQAAIKQREEQEQAWGGASTAGLQSFANSFNATGIASTALKLAPLALA